MEKPKTYIETIIVSYLTTRPSRDLIVAAHQQITQEWWENRSGEFDLYVSQLVIQEASGGDEQAVQRRLKAIERLPLLQLNEKAVVLAGALIDEGALPKKASGDALHIAIATVHGMDYLLTWNLRHLANAIIRNAIFAICRASMRISALKACFMVSQPQDLGYLQGSLRNQNRRYDQPGNAPDRR